MGDAREERQEEGRRFVSARLIVPATCPPGEDRDVLAAVALPGWDATDRLLVLAWVGLSPGIDPRYVDLRLHRGPVAPGREPRGLTVLVRAEVRWGVSLVAGAGLDSLGSAGGRPYKASVRPDALLPDVIDVRQGALYLAPIRHTAESAQEVTRRALSQLLAVLAGP